MTHLPYATADTRPPPPDAETVWTATYRWLALLDEALATDCGTRIPSLAAHRVPAAHHGDEPPPRPS